MSQPSLLVLQENSWRSTYQFGGDQLTCARAQSAKCHQHDSATATERLDGLVPVVEGWHTKMCLFVNNIGALI